MADIENVAESDLLTYDNLQKFKDKQRFWLYQTDDNLFIFDQHVSDIYPIEDELRDLILADNAEAFEKIKAELSEEALDDNNAFVSQILELPDEPIEDRHSKTKIATLKLNISSRCNLACRYCFREKENEQDLADKNLIFKAIDYLINDCGQDLDSYTIGLNLSSEPLLHLELLEELFDYLKKIQNKTGKHLEIFFITNGTIIDDKVLKVLKKVRKERTLSISFDGPQPVHDANRVTKSGNGTYEQIVSNLKFLKKKGMEYAAEVVLNKTNPQPLDILKHLLELGFESINIKPIRYGTTSSFTMDDLEALKKGYDDYFAYIEEQLSQDKTKILAVLAKDYALRPFWRILFNHKMDVRCTWGMDTISMDYKGDFYPCDSVMSFAEYCMGNVNDGINWDKYHQSLNVELRSNCRDCWARNICGGTCPVNNILRNQDILAVDPIECALTKHLVEKNLILLCNLIDKGYNLNLLRKILGYNLYNIYLAK